MGKTLNAALLASLLAGAASLQAEEWIDFGAPFAGSGGAGAALGRGAGGGYYNPANLSRRPWVDESIFTIEFDIPAGATAGIHGDSFRYIFDTVEKANDLYDRFQDGAFNTASNSLTFEDIQFAFEVFDALDQLDSLNGDGMYAATAAGLSARLANVILPRDAFGFSMAGFGLGAATAVVDLDSLRGYRLADESGATWEALIGIAVANSGQPAPSPTTPGGIQFSADLQAAGYSAATADTLAAQAEAAGMNFGGEGASILFDFLVNTLNGTGTSLESGANPLEGNQSGFLLRGLAYYEFALSYSFGVPLFGASDWLSVGASLKFYQAYTFSELLTIEEMDSNGVQDSIDSLRSAVTDAYNLDGDAARFNVGLDLGIVFTPPVVKGLAVSVSARNINGPEFHWDSSWEGEPALVRLEPQFRAGVAYTLWPDFLGLSFAVEADLNAVSSDILPRYHTQFVRAGVAFEPDFGLFALGVRVGALKNIADADQALTATAGFGFRVAFFRLDMGAQLAVNTNDFGTSWDFEPIPQRFGAWVQLGISIGF